MVTVNAEWISVWKEAGFEQTCDHNSSSKCETSKTSFRIQIQIFSIGGHLLFEFCVTFQCSGRRFTGASICVLWLWLWGVILSCGMGLMGLMGLWYKDTDISEEAVDYESLISIYRTDQYLPEWSVSTGLIRIYRTDQDLPEWSVSTGLISIYRTDQDLPDWSGSIGLISIYRTDQDLPDWSGSTGLISIYRTDQDLPEWSVSTGRIRIYRTDQDLPDWSVSTELQVETAERIMMEKNMSGELTDKKNLKSWLENLWKESQSVGLCVDLRRIKWLPSCLNDVQHVCNLNVCFWPWHIRTVSKNLWISLMICEKQCPSVARRYVQIRIIKFFYSPGHKISGLFLSFPWHFRVT